jgi:hypothetical protein
MSVDAEWSGGHMLAINLYTPLLTLKERRALLDITSRTLQSTYEDRLHEAYV